MGKDNPVLVGDRIAAAMSHPTRVYAMSVFWDREASPRQIAAELNEPINNVTYHVKQLRDLGWIELVAQRPAHGGRVVEHFYKAVQDSDFSDAAVASLGDKERVLLDQAILRQMSRELNDSLLSGTFFETSDNYLSRIPIDVDAEGWEESKAILGRALEELLAVREAVLDRVAKSGEPTRPTKISLIQFYSPDSGGKSA